MSGGTTRNAGALARARSANRTSRFLSLDSADDKLALIGPDLETAVSEFFGDEASKHLGAALTQLQLQQQQQQQSSAPVAADVNARAALLTTMNKELQGRESVMPMRGLLKKRGGAAVSAGMVTTWHWRFCVLHNHALAIHDGHSRPKTLRSAIPLKHVLRIAPAADAESGKRPFAFTIETDLDRSWTFCAMSQGDFDTWLSRIRECTKLTHASGLSHALHHGGDGLLF